MRVNKDDLNRLKYLEREITNPHFKKVITSVIHNIQVNNSVYILQEIGRWDSEEINNIKIYSTFAEAKKEYQRLIEEVKHDILKLKNWSYDPEISEQYDEDSEEAFWQICDPEDYESIHDSIIIERKEVLEYA